MYRLLTEKERTELKTKDLKKDDVLFREGDICHYACIVLDGEIIIRTIDDNGNEIIFAKTKKGQIFGNNLLFSNDKKYKGDVIATRDTKVLFIEEKELLNILQTNTQFLIAYLSEQANITKELNSKIKLSSISSAKERFMFYLKEHNNNIEYTSITSLSKELGFQRETLSRLLSKLKKEKVVNVSNNKIKRG